MHTTLIRPLFIVLVAATIAGCSESPLGVECRAARRGDELSSRYSCLSDQQLLTEITRVDGRVSIGFKEAGAVRGVDATGRNLTSDETKHATKQLLLQRGMTFTWQASGIPAVSGRIPLRLRLISDLRRHPNIDYLEPASFGTLSSQAR